MIPPKTLLGVWRKLHPKSTPLSKIRPAAMVIPSEGEFAGMALISSHSTANGYEDLGLRLFIPVACDGGSVRGDAVYELGPSSVRTIADSVKRVSETHLRLKWIRETGSTGDRYTAGDNGAVELSFAESGVLPFPIDPDGEPLRSLDADFSWFIPLWGWTTDADGAFPRVVFREGKVAATDGHKLALLDVPSPSDEAFAILGSHLRLAKSLCKMDKASVQWTRHKDHLLIRGSNWQLALPVGLKRSSEFPNYEPILQQMASPCWTGTLRCADVVKFLKLARKAASSQIGKHSVALLKLSPTPAGLALRYAVDFDGSDNRVYIDMPDATFSSFDSGSPDVGSVFVDPAYFLSALDLSKSESLHIRFVEETMGEDPSSAVMMVGGEPRRTTLVMPMRIKEQNLVELDDVLRARAAAGKVA